MMSMKGVQLVSSKETHNMGLLELLISRHAYLACAILLRSDTEPIATNNTVDYGPTPSACLCADFVDHNICQLVQVCDTFLFQSLENVFLRWFSLATHGLFSFRETGSLED